MLIKRSLVVLVLLVLLAGTVMVSAGAVKADPGKKSDELVIVSGYSMEPVITQDAAMSVSAMSIYTIRQFQTNWHSKYINQGCPGYYLDLNWGNSANSLQLRVYTPDGRVYGPFYDGSDGRVDGRIYLWVWKTGGLPGGNYYHEVYGYRVSGVEDYTF